MILQTWNRDDKNKRDMIQQWNREVRSEDLKHREIEEERYLVDSAREEVDDKVRQLSIIAELSAILGGFATAMISNPNYPQDGTMSSAISAAHGGFCMAGACMLFYSIINCTFLMIAVLKYDCHKRDTPFQEFWIKRCEADWKRAFRAFTFGVPMVLTSLCLLDWLLLGSYLIACILISAICFITQVAYILRIHSKWADFLTSTTGDIAVSETTRN